MSLYFNSTLGMQVNPSNSPQPQTSFNQQDVINLLIKSQIQRTQQHLRTISPANYTSPISDYKQQSSRMNDYSSINKQINTQSKSPIYNRQDLKFTQNQEKRNPTFFRNKYNLFETKYENNPSLLMQLLQPTQPLLPTLITDHLKNSTIKEFQDYLSQQIYKHILLNRNQYKTESKNHYINGVLSDHQLSQQDREDQDLKKSVCVMLNHYLQFLTSIIDLLNSQIQGSSINKKRDPYESKINQNPKNYFTNQDKYNQSENPMTFKPTQEYTANEYNKLEPKTRHKSDYHEIDLSGKTNNIYDREKFNSNSKTNEKDKYKFNSTYDKDKELYNSNSNNYDKDRGNNFDNNNTQNNSNNNHHTNVTPDHSAKINQNQNASDNNNITFNNNQNNNNYFANAQNRIDPIARINPIKDNYDNTNTTYNNSANNNTNRKIDPTNKFNFQGNSNDNDNAKISQQGYTNNDQKNTSSKVKKIPTKTSQEQAPASIDTQQFSSFGEQKSPIERSNEQNSKINDYSKSPSQLSKKSQDINYDKNSVTSSAKAVANEFLMSIFDKSSQKASQIIQQEENKQLQEDFLQINLSEQTKIFQQSSVSFGTDFQNEAFIQSDADEPFDPKLKDRINIPSDEEDDDY